MKVPVRWLQEFVETGLAPEALGYRLTMAGLEAEKIERIGAGWDGVFVAMVRRVEQHPNADRLVLADVNAEKHRLTVVTGAPNIAAGQKVALAIAGARLIDGHSESLQYRTLKPGVIRGVRSEGMVCSEKELGLSDEHEGIMVLEPDAPVGAPLVDWLGDTVIEFEITPNLVHAFSIAGIAREAGAVTDRPVRMPDAPALSTLARPANDLITIDAPELCARYIGVVIQGITVGPSPPWLARRLTACGVRPINNVVDVTNYVMLELGQPLHAFDRDRLGEGRIVVRRAADGEQMETLDHQLRTFSPETLLIADAERAVAVAGVIGGLESEVADDTTTILLESANFEMKAVRATARRLNIRTEASARFERGLDPNLAGIAAACATALLLAIIPGSSVVAWQDVYPRPVEPHSLSLPLATIERVLGIPIPDDTVLDVLTRLGFVPAIDAGSTLTVVVPTWRSDVTIAEDVVEEVARIVGYDHLPATLPTGTTPPVERDPAFLFERGVRATLVGAGCFEGRTYVAASRDDLVRFGEADGDGFAHRLPPDALLRLRNPIRAGENLLRPT
ncbi:MAG: phenylalanine--tRNA ligase subunit beta, partial [Chloroflexia bacterium]|nr:phenylalanine--tRNA ligase subunit beta [Chloroflexia bacterium]